MSPQNDAAGALPHLGIAERRDAVQEAVRILQEQLGPNAVRVYVFGSVARGEARASSDMDLAIDAGAPVPETQLAVIRDALEESRIAYTIELVDLARVSPVMREHILKEGVLWTD